MPCPYIHVSHLDIDLKTRKANAKEGAPKSLDFNRRKHVAVAELLKDTALQPLD